MMFDEVLLDDLDDELLEKEKNLQLITSMIMCHIKNKEQGVTTGGIQKYSRE